MVEYFNGVHRMDLSTHTWQEVAPMHFCRCSVCITVLIGCVHAMGGSDGHLRLSTTERYRPDTNQWSVTAPTHDIRSDASCTTLNDKVAEVKEQLRLVTERCMGLTGTLLV